MITGDEILTIAPIARQLPSKEKSKWTTIFFFSSEAVSLILGTFVNYTLVESITLHQDITSRIFALGVLILGQIVCRGLIEYQGKYGLAKKMIQCFPCSAFMGFAMGAILFKRNWGTALLVSVTVMVTVFQWAFKVYHYSNA